MIGHAILYGIALAGNCAIVTGTMYSPLNADPTTIRLYKTVPRINDLEYTILKRGSQDAQESPDSKERRSQMGSSFIRFGRSRYEGGNLENADYASDAGGATGGGGGDVLDTAGSRTARGRSDVIIRFGRDDTKNFRNTGTQQQQQQRQISGAGIKLLRFGNKSPQSLHRGNDFEQLAIVCSNVLASIEPNGNELGLYVSKLVRLCNSLGLGADENNGIRRKSNIIEILNDASQAESVKNE